MGSMATLAVSCTSSLIQAPMISGDWIMALLVRLELCKFVVNFYLSASNET